MKQIDISIFDDIPDFEIEKDDSIPVILDFETTGFLENPMYAARRLLNNSSYGKLPK